MWLPGVIEIRPFRPLPSLSSCRTIRTFSPGTKAHLPSWAMALSTLSSPPTWLDTPVTPRLVPQSSSRPDGVQIGCAEDASFLYHKTLLPPIVGFSYCVIVVSPVVAASQPPNIRDRSIACIISRPAVALKGHRRTSRRGCPPFSSSFFSSFLSFF
ncbi:hypothetical protein SODALDRAFT_18391 [Sodiomyces alkalinus F11]|uniref:Uncharacterized protein n=1 Tax=Sodiomyces alkalinus (strain CBS 110278 / VKM F-3762 / F11) TaxID=1314773 RepID=A0A3N2Q7A6_SODAK|nr:hypothetical protein SODALDRAFT_18391 [Sodiomyces alkalinus F11]ROT42567.1 hypothetical protein SODALDRAFT_18391 [Sodiomyces alkalinus F11]